jgi:virginiamycin B lyase
MLAIAVLSVLVLALGGRAIQRPAIASQTATSAPRGVTGAQAPQAPTSVPAATSASVQTASIQKFDLPTQNSGLMQPAVDREGNVWFGEMATNRLGELDPRTGKVSEWVPPNGRNNIMAITVDSSDHVWFTEQAGNYIGRFDAATQRFTAYPLAQVDGHAMAPQDLQFDATGKLWFSAVSARVGRLDPSTGVIQTWIVPMPSKETPAYPYSIAVSDDGQVWVGLLSGGAVGRLDPSTGKVELHYLANTQSQVFSMAPDRSGNIWFTELQDGNIGQIDMRSGAVKEIAVPQMPGAPQATPSGFYAIRVTPDGDVWLACTSANGFVRYVPTTGKFTYFQLPVENSVPFGLALGDDGRLWFTADKTDDNYVGMLRP